MRQIAPSIIYPYTLKRLVQINSQLLFLQCLGNLKVVRTVNVVKRDNVVYWKTKRKIKNDLQSTG